MMIVMMTKAQTTDLRTEIPVSQPVRWSAKQPSSP